MESTRIQVLNYIGVNRETVEKIVNLAIEKFEDDETNINTIMFSNIGSKDILKVIINDFYIYVYNCNENDLFFIDC